MRTFALLFVPCAVAAPVAAQEDATGQAAAAFEQGLALFDEENWAGALAAFQRAYALSPNFLVRYNIGQCYRALHRYPEAIDALQAYIDEGADRVDPARREEVEATLRELRGFLGSLRIDVDVPGATVTVDSVVRGTTPLAEPIVVGAGQHVVAATAEGFRPAQTEVVLAGGEERTVALRLEPLPEPVVAPPPPLPPPIPAARVEPPAPWYEDWVGWTLVGVGVAAVGVGGGLLYLRDKRFDQAAEPWRGITERDALEAEGEEYQTAGFSVLGVGLGAIVAGVVLFVVDAATAPDSDDEASPSPAVSVVPGATGLVVEF
jgi:tetratricopeptide (TPR) repeat protein